MSKIPTSPPRLVAMASLAAASALFAVALVTGCTSDTPSPLGADLAETSVDTVLVPLTVEQMEDFGVLAVNDPNTPLDDTEVLYFGRSATDESSILANLDFGFLDEPDQQYLIPYLTRQNIASVKIQLIMLEWYGPWRDGASPSDTLYVPPPVKEWPGAPKYIDVHRLTAPFDTLSYPGPEPSWNFGLINENPSELYTDELVWIDCRVDPVVDWIESRGKVGLIFREGTGSTPGILGFASKEMKRGGSTLPQEHEDVTLGVAMIIDLNVEPDQWPSSQQFLTIQAVADVSTWHVLEPPFTDPADGIMVRTHLRSYPMLQFDLSSVPANARINRANLVVVTDTTRSEGHRTTLTVSEIRPEFVPPGETTILLNDLEPELYLLSGSQAWYPEHLTVHKLDLNVTASLQRYINSVYDGERGFQIATGEAFFPGYNASPEADFWFTKWIFHGTSAEPELRPRLEISYTLIDELEDPEGTP